MSHLQQMRETIEAQIALLSDRLEQISHVSDHSAEFTAKTFEYNSLRNKLAPISSLPNEILTTIFQIGCQLASSPLQTSFHRALAFEILISHVVHHWRKVVLGMPELWTIIHRAQYAQSLDPIAAYLRRSKQLPIQLKIRIGSHVPRRRTHGDRVVDDDESSDEMKDDIASFCCLIKPHVERCCRLSIISDTYSQECVQMLHLLSSTPTPILWSLDVSIPLRFEYLQQPLQIFGSGAKSLTHVYLDRTSLFQCHPPLGTVTTLHLDLSQEAIIRIQNEHTFRELSNSLSVMPFLVHLDIQEAEWPSDVPIILPTLRTLFFDVGCLSDASGLLLALKAPSLQDMKIGWSLIGGNLDPQLVVGGPSNFPSLRRLYLALHAGAMHMGSMETLSWAFPSLTEIMMADLFRGYTCIHRLLILMAENQSSGHGAGAWPHLHTLAISPFSNDTFPTTALQNFLVKRAEASCAIEKLLLPKAHIARGAELSSCVRQPLRIAEFTGYGPSPFPGR